MSHAVVFHATVLSNSYLVLDMRAVSVGTESRWFLKVRRTVFRHPDFFGFEYRLGRSGGFGAGLDSKINTSKMMAGANERAGGHPFQL
eukprot:2700312-Amphidinium_carterae.1